MSSAAAGAASIDSISSNERLNEGSDQGVPTLIPSAAKPPAQAVPGAEPAGGHHGPAINTLTALEMALRRQATDLGEGGPDAPQCPVGLNCLLRQRY